MSENKIEYSNQSNKFTAAEIRAKVAESKRYWASPEGIAEKRKQDLAAKNRKPIPIKFPELAKRNTTRPELSVWEAKYRLLKNQ